MLGAWEARASPDRQIRMLVVAIQVSWNKFSSLSFHRHGTTGHQRESCIHLAEACDFSRISGGRHIRDPRCGCRRFPATHPCSCGRPCWTIGRRGRHRCRSGGEPRTFVDGQRKAVRLHRRRSSRVLRQSLPVGAVAGRGSSPGLPVEYAVEIPWTRRHPKRAWS